MSFVAVLPASARRREMPSLVLVGNELRDQGGGVGKCPAEWRCRHAA
jgi:hypothetical protein